MKGPAYFLSGTDPVSNLAAEEALLESSAVQDGHILLFYRNSPCAVVGRSQNPWAEVSAQAVRQGLPVLRRVSGGGTVFHDCGNLNWSVISPRGSHDRSAQLALVIAALNSLGIAAREAPRGGIVLSEGAFAGFKISGTARRFSAHRVLHHGTLLLNAQLDSLEAALGGLAIRRPEGLASVPSPVVNLNRINSDLSPEKMADSIARQFMATSPEALDPLQLGAIGDSAVAEASRERLRSWVWTWGATPAFSLDISCQNRQYGLLIKNGLIASISGVPPEILAGVTGKPFDYDTPRYLTEILAGI